MSTALLVRDDKSLSICISPAAMAQKEQVLLHATFIESVEEDRKSVKAPVLEYGRAIDAAAKTFCEALKSEEVRIAALVGTFQEHENARVRAAQQAENERLTALEREKAALLAKATTEAQVDKIQEQFNLRAQQESLPVVAPARVGGQCVKPDWDITVSDIHLLYRAHPACVKLEALPGQIKSLLNSGVKVAGVTAKPIVKSTVRTTTKDI